MISVTVLYPHKAGAKFDMGYYLSKHMPMVQKLLGSDLKGCVVEHGLSGVAPGSQPAYTVILHLRFDSVESFNQSFGPHASVIQNDIPNYSSEPPVIQISDIKLS